MADEDKYRPDVQERLQQYFRSKSRQLLAAAEEVITDHAGLRGGHRETILRIYLSSILPRRFEAGRGMVYNQFQRSQECDIVIWDAHDYPSLPMSDHNFFFAESTKAVLEVKTRWSSNEFANILEKSSKVQRLLIPKTRSLADDIAMLQLDIEAIRRGEEHSGFLSIQAHIATAGIIIFGGREFSLNAAIKKMELTVHEAWPDLLLLLEAGIVIVKSYEHIEDANMTVRGVLRMYQSNEDALLIFTAGLLGSITERSLQVGEPFYLAEYIAGLVADSLTEIREFPLIMPVLIGKRPIWGG